jgi:high-affinity nickel-transport protein
MALPFLAATGGYALGLGAFTVFVLGLRHGADPDHLAAIDNVTRNAFSRTPMLSRFVGTFFATGHSVMVLAISMLVGLAGSHFTAHGELIETIGTWISIVVLFLVAALNIRTLQSGATSIAGAKTRLLPRALRDSSNALVAFPVGFLFGFGFETSSQIAAYSVAFAVNGGLIGGLIVGLTFSLGMICTDTLDSLLVHRLISHRSGRLPKVMRVWIGSVTVLAIAVALYETAQVLGWRSPVADLTVSAILVAALAIVFAYVFVRTRNEWTTLPAAESP